MAQSMTRYRRAAGPDDRSLFVLPVKQGAPARLTVNLPYEYSQRVSPGVVTAVDTVLKINDCNDLNFSAAGSQQPRGWDQWAAFYERYRVNYVTVKFSVRQRAAHGLRVYAVLNSSNSDLSGDSRIGEMERASLLGITASGTEPVEVTRTFYPASAFGFSKDQYQSDETVAAGYGASPAAIAYLHLVGAQVDLTTAADFEFTISMIVNVTLTDRITIAAS
jgi:hypothetical protein